MKKILAVLALSVLAALSTQAQGYVSFSNGSSTSISTNKVENGAGAGLTSGPGISGPLYFFALYYSTNETAVNGQTAAISGGTNVNYAFNDSLWKLAAYGTNFFSGYLLSASSDASGRTPVPELAGGTSARFVVIGWSANIGTNIASLQGWFGTGNPAYDGWIGQSPVSGAITPGTSTATTLFGTAAPLIPSFLLGRVTNSSSSMAPYIVSQPASQTVVYNSSVSFTVSYDANPAPAIQWQFNSMNIAGATNAVLALTNVTLASGGNYSVTLTNSAGLVTSSNAVLTVLTPPSYVLFQNFKPAAAVVYTNSAVGGGPTGLAGSNDNLYVYALFASTNATSVNGQTAAILGNASGNYAFNDSDWVLVAYGTNSSGGRFNSADANGSGLTPVSLGASVISAQFVVIGWSADIGPDLTAVEAWFNGGNPASDGWIGQSAVSGAIVLGGDIFGNAAPYLQGFTLGLASPDPAAAYAAAPTPALILQGGLSGQDLKLSWPLAAGSYGVISASSPAGPWSDAGLTVTNDGVNCYATVPAASQPQYFRLIEQ